MSLEEEVSATLVLKFASQPLGYIGILNYFTNWSYTVPNIIEQHTYDIFDLSVPEEITIVSYAFFMRLSSAAQGCEL